MTAAVLRAISSGFNARQVLNFITRSHPQYAQRINGLMAAGYTADKILKHITDKEGKTTEDQYLTESEKTDRQDAERKKRVAINTIAALGTAGAVGAGLYQALSPQASGAIQPSQILPAQQAAQRAQQPTTINMQNRGLPNQQRGLPAPPARGLPSPKIPGGTQALGPIQPQPMQQTQQPISPAPQPMPSAPVPQRDPTKNLMLVKNLKEDGRISNLIQGGLPTAQIAGVLKSLLPKDKFQALQSGEGGIEQVIEDVASTIQNQQSIPREKDVQEAPIQPPPIPQEKALQPVEQPIEQPKKEPEISKEIQTNDRVQTPKGNAKVKDIHKKVATVVFDNGSKGQYDTSKLKKLEQAKPLKEKEFAIPNYRYADDTDEDFKDRETMFSAVEKAAKAISEGKSFLDFPVSKQALKGVGGYSVAEDVLRFMAGIPNVYDSLLDEDEKEDLTDGLFETGAMTVEGLRPTKGEAKAAYGAPMTPNMVWNMLLSVEPKLAEIKKPKSIKGAKAPGARMSTTDIRRMLTHSVYGALSGKKITTKLADKITKISQAASYSDALTKAFEEGNRRKQDQEMERLMDDDYYYSLFTDEIEDMVKKYR